MTVHLHCIRKYSYINNTPLHVLLRLLISVIFPKATSCIKCLVAISFLSDTNNLYTRLERKRAQIKDEHTFEKTKTIYLLKAFIKEPEASSKQS